MELKLKKYSAPWCGQCKTLAKEFQRNPIACDVIEINIDELEDEVLEQIGIKSIPMCVLFNGDTELKKWVGFVSSKEINDYIESCQLL